MMERGSPYEERYLTEDDISAELLADTLSDVPDDADSDSENEREKSANEIDDDDETLDSAVSTWVKTDKIPNLGPFTANPGVKQIPSDPTKVLQVTGLFLGDIFFDMLCEEMNRYYLQSQEKYVTGYKGLKWSDVTVAETKIFFNKKRSETQYIVFIAKEVSK